MTVKNLTTLIMVAACSGSYHLQAQEAAVEYNTEWQTNFKGEYKWVNLLRLSGTLPVTQNLAFEGATISVARTGNYPLIEDLQGYSNIDEENLPLAIAVLGANVKVSNSSVFLGIRNVNEDYFITPVTSFFVNSSCGIFPTISNNHDIANYPLAGWCLHYRLELRKFAIQTSLFEGRGHRRIGGHDNVFRFSPSKDGIFSITSAEYINDDSNYSLGCAVYYGVYSSDEDGVQAETTQTTHKKKKVSAAPWVNLEQRLTERCDLMLQASFSTLKHGCKYYLGAGSTYQADKVQLGIFVDYAKYDAAYEAIAELTCRIPIVSKIYFQPAIEGIITDGNFGAVAIMRLNINL